MEIITEIEEALVAQWSHFGRWPRGELHEQHGLVWTENPIASLPYNAVVRTRLDTGSADSVLDAVLARYRNRAVDFMWIEHPTATPADLGSRLEARGLAPVEHVTGMSIELREWDPRAPAGRVEEVLDHEGLATYADLLIRYWDIPEADQVLVAELNSYWSPARARGHRFLAYAEDGVPIGKGYLSLAGPPGVASLYGMSVIPEARGRGVATAMTCAMLNRAKQAGCRRAVLHSSEVAVGVYRRAGFVERCPLRVFATDRLWSGDH